MTQISGKARLGKNPELKYVGDDDDKKPVCELRVRFINGKKNKATDEWEDQGFWAQVNVWGKLAEPAAKLVSKGDLVHIEGDLSNKVWMDKDDASKEHSMLCVDSHFIAPVISDIEALSYKPRNTNTEDSETAAAGAGA